MRTLSFEEYEKLDPEDGDRDTPRTRFLDWKDSVAVTLEAVDDLLADHGLEIVQYDTGQDAYQFKIERRVVEA